MADEQDILLQFWQEQRNQARQSETQRATLTNIVLVVASAAIGLVVHQGTSRRSVLVVTVGLIALGLYGAVTSMKYRERCALHFREAKAIRHRLDALFPTIGLEADRQEARDDHRRRHRRLYRLRLHYLWTALHVGVAATGTVMTVIVLV